MKKKFEIEQKYRIKNPSAMRRKIRALKAKFLGKGAENNELFDFKNSLRRRRAILRLRQCHSGAFLTFKGPRLKGVFKKRIEVETRVDYAAAKAILELAGFRVVARYDKKREEFKLGSAHLVIDYLSGFGWFVEIEEEPEQIISIEKKLGLTLKDREDRSYPQMIYGSRWR